MVTLALEARSPQRHALPFWGSAAAVGVAGTATVSSSALPGCVQGGVLRLVPVSEGCTRFCVTLFCALMSSWSGTVDLLYLYNHI